MKYTRKNQLKQAEMQGNEAQITQEATGSRKMTMQSKKEIQNQLQAGYMQNNEPQTMRGETGSWKMTKQFEKQFKNQSQSGRSMIEMLGVLAIIAVLSIGGIVGFRLAMNYYQANQIAHEMNIMRTDAQIKIAQGAEKLTLGAPYDAHKINFNNYDTAFGCKYVDENDIISEQTVSCQIANAYFIELPKIPDGVCQPLIRLINGMDNLIAFSVNDSEYEEGGTCQEGENDLYAIFSGETVSDLTHCERDDDCKELESTPVCDLSRHICVQCKEDDDCPYNTDYCENNVCKTCESGVWNGKDCVECTTNDDCENPTPICSEENTCVGCKTSDECRSKNSSEANCTENGACCADSLMTWNGNECVCPENKPWNGKSCGCDSNNDCKSDEFCLTSGCIDQCSNSDDSCTLTEEESCADATHQCVKVSEYQASNHDLNSNPYILSNQGMNWWSTERFCERHHKNMLKISDLDCCESFGETTEGYCYAKEDICSTTNGLSDIVKAVRKAENGTENEGIKSYWLKDPSKTDIGNNSYRAYHLILTSGFIHYCSRQIDYYYALCK